AAPKRPSTFFSSRNNNLHQTTPPPHVLLPFLTCFLHPLAAETRRNQQPLTSRPVATDPWSLHPDFMGFPLKSRAKNSFSPSLGFSKSCFGVQVAAHSCSSRPSLAAPIKVTSLLLLLQYR
ncbi:hypothetical protein AABB24_034799, partial [Solanum stoloniferum]